MFAQVMYSPDLRPEFGEFAAFQWTRTTLCRTLRHHFERRRQKEDPPIRVGTDVAFYYDPGDKLARVEPDLYVLPGLGYDEQLRSYKVWERGGRAPVLAIHLVEGEVAPEDGLMMHFYRLGLLDVVLYDPLWWLQPGGSPTGRRLLCHYARGEHKFLAVPQEHPGRLHLKNHGLWLVHVGGEGLAVYSSDGQGTRFPGESARVTLGDCEVSSE